MSELGTNHERTKRRPKVFFWTTGITVALLCLVGIIVVIRGAMPPFSDSYYYHVYYRDNILCTGGANADGTSLIFEDFLVLADKEDRVIARNSTVSLSINGEEYNIVETTPSTLKAIVGDGESIEEYIDSHNILWVIIDNSISDSQISYKITFTFDNNRVRGFSFFQNTQSDAESKYRIAIDGQVLPALPTSLEEMEKILGEAISIERQRKFQMGYCCRYELK